MDNSEKTPYRPTIDNQAALTAAWSRLMQPLGFSAHAVWLMLIDADSRPVPQLIEIAETQDPPRGEERAGFVKFLRMLTGEVLPEGARVAFLVARPGPAITGQRDRVWATELYGACREVGLPCETVHLAGDDDVRPLPLDDLDLGRIA